MKETERIIKLFDGLYQGHPWLDVTFMDTLKNMTAQQAAKKIHPGCNSVWEVLNHLISWRLAILERIEGHDVKSPENNFFSPVTDQSVSAWNKTLINLEDSQKKWVNYLREFSTDRFDQIPDTRPFTRYELIHGILQHDAYHLGQIKILSKSV
jgi:uncharacterized damage-inducible protein DinB